MYKYYIQCEDKRTVSRIRRRLDYHGVEHYVSEKRLFLLSGDIDFPLNLTGARMYRLVDEEEFQYMRDILEKEGLLDYVDGESDETAPPG